MGNDGWKTKEEVAEKQDNSECRQARLSRAEIFGSLQTESGKWHGFSERTATTWERLGKI